MKITPGCIGTEEGSSSFGPINPQAPELAAAFAFGGVSLGQFYNGHVIRGTIWGVLFILLLCLMAEGLVPLVTIPFFLAACSLDAWSTAGEMRAGTIPARKTSPLFWIQATLMVSGIAAWSLTLVISILGAL